MVIPSRNLRLSDVSRHWDCFWFHREDPIPASCFRIFLGILLIVTFIALFPNWERFYSSQGMLSLREADPRSRWSLFTWTEAFVPIGFIWWLGFISAITFTLGFQTRLSTILLFLVQSSMVLRNVAVVNGEDLVCRMLLFLACFAPLGQTLSLDSWLKHSRQENPVQEATFSRFWAIRLLQINILLIYVISLPNKLADDVAWWDGTAIYWSMMSDSWSRWPWPGLFYGGLLSPILTYGTILVEGLFPLLVWFKKTRAMALLAIAGLHLGIAICLQNVTFFSIAMVCSFWLFVPAASLRWLVGRSKLTGRIR